MSITEKVYYMAIPHPKELEKLTQLIKNDNLICAFCDEPANAMVLPHIGFGQQARNQLKIDLRSGVCKNCFDNHTPDELDGCYLRKKDNK